MSGSGTPKHDRHVPDSEVGSAGSGGSGSGSGSGSSYHGQGHGQGKPRGSRLARRARSFKDDFLEILSQMRSPGGSGGGGGGGFRSGSPQSPKARTPVKVTKSDAGEAPVDRNPLQDLDAHVRQVQFALKHFSDVVSNNKLEVLPGNGTVVLETVTTIHSALKTCLLNEQSSGNQSSLLVSATNQVYQSMAQLIKLCDDVLLNKALNKDTVAEVIAQVEQAVLNLVTLAREKLAHRNSLYKPAGGGGGQGGVLVQVAQNLGGCRRGAGMGARPQALLDCKSTYSVAGLDLPQRNSLPDIPLTPRERQILEETSKSVIERHHHHQQHHLQRHNSHHNSHSHSHAHPHPHHYSQSSDSVLLDVDVDVEDSDAPPPKPPLPGGRARPWCLSEGGGTGPSPSGEPPPLPPKRRMRQSADGLGGGGGGGGPVDRLGLGLVGGMEVLSLRSKSPDDTASLLSASAGSLDSVLNHSRDEEEELRVLMDPDVEDPDPEPDCGRDLGLGLGDLAGGGGGGAMNLDLRGHSRGHRVNVNGSCYSHSPEAEHPAALPRDRDRDSAFCPSVPPNIQQLSSSQAESGFASMHSLRSSTQSYTTSASSHNRSSQQSSVSVNCHAATTSSTTAASMSVLSQSQRTISVSSSSSSSATRLGFTPLEDESMLTLNSTDTSPMERISSASSGSSPPALPQKTRSRHGPRRERLLSQYDNVPGSDVTDSPRMEMSPQRQQDQLELEQLDQLRCLGQSATVIQSQSHSALQISSTSPSNLTLPAHKSAMTLSGPSPEGGRPPPLPLKKKHMFQSVAYSVMAYMEMFGNCSHSNNNDFLRHSMHTYNVLQAEWQQRDSSFTAVQSRSFHYHQDSLSKSPVLVEAHNSIPPALPPKRSRTSSVRSVSSPPPVSPPPTTSSSPVLREEKKKHNLPKLELSPKPLPSLSVASSTPPSIVPAVPATTVEPPLQLPQTNRQSEIHVPPKTPVAVVAVEELVVINPLDELDILRHLVLKKQDEEGPEIRGGHEDGLVVHATKANKNEENETDFLYQEAFLTTYRTFMSPLELIQKLCYRHQRFHCSAEVAKQRAAKESFSLLVRVVSDLTNSDLDDTVLQTLMNFVYQLLCNGDLTMAKALRVKILEKHSIKTLYNTSNNLLPSQNVYTRYRQASLLDFKSEQIAEQMTLLDAQLFMKIEIPEVLIWAQEQNEERSPNLTRFTEHFNKMSYWARSRILEQSEAKDRERYVMKFIKIMKHLRKMNNFNSYLALLSALDSAPIRRLEWQKHITEGLKEYCALIDSSSSFRAYRQALADTNPPCIPYIGLVLQDLTFVHIGNSDLLADGNINFSKRWQQFNIVENMKRFKKGTYSFKKQERIIAFFSNFDEFLSEEAMWQISESIKPRGGKKVATAS